MAKESKKDKFIRKSVVYNRNSAWHMEIYNRLMKESDNHSGYVLSILKEHFDRKPNIEFEKIPDQTEQEKEQPIEATQITVNGKIVRPDVAPPKLFNQK